MFLNLLTLLVANSARKHERRAADALERMSGKPRYSVGYCLLQAAFWGFFLWIFIRTYG